MEITQRTKEMFKCLTTAHTDRNEGLPFSYAVSVDNNLSVILSTHRIFLILIWFKFAIFTGMKRFTD